MTEELSSSTATGSAAVEREKESFDERILAPYRYLANIPGKKIRTKLIQSFNHWLKIPNDKLNQITDIIELLHNSSLLIDDIEDNSLLRRGRPVAHQVYGVPLTINAANLIYFIGLQKSLDLKHENAATVYTGNVEAKDKLKQLIELHQGQGMEIWFRDNFICPNEEEYRILVIKKTGGLFKLAIRLMQLYVCDDEDEETKATNKGSDDYSQIIDAMGLFFQIRDDYANLVSKDYSDAKSFCDDITEGKFSYPVIHSLSNNFDSEKRLMEIIKMRTLDIELKKEAIEILEKNGSFKYTIQILDNLKSKIFTELAKKGGNPYLEGLLKELGKMIE